MGMFDNVELHGYPIPDNHYATSNETLAETVFQTKDLDNALDTYFITEEGRLMHNQVTYELTPEEERPWKNDPELMDHPLADLVGMLRPVKSEIVDTDYHGYLKIYTSIDNEWIEFVIKFTDGKVVSMEPQYREFGK